MLLPVFLFLRGRCEMQRPLLFGAEDEARTRYLHLGKVALYQMSYSRNSKSYYIKKMWFVNTFLKIFLLLFLGGGRPGRNDAAAGGIILPGPFIPGLGQGVVVMKEVCFRAAVGDVYHP